MSPGKESLEEYVHFEMAAVWGDMFVFGSVVLLCFFCATRHVPTCNVHLSTIIGLWLPSLGLKMHLATTK